MIPRPAYRLPANGTAGANKRTWYKVARLPHPPPSQYNPSLLHSQCPLSAFQEAKSVSFLSDWGDQQC